MILDHGNGYFTRYAHLAYIGAQPGARLPAQVEPADVLGIMGSTGNSFGTHLHFAVHRDDGNDRWDGGDKDKPADPFGWAGTQPDPWAQSVDGAASRWLCATDLVKRESWGKSSTMHPRVGTPRRTPSQARQNEEEELSIKTDQQRWSAYQCARPSKIME